MDKNINFITVTLIPADALKGVMSFQTSLFVGILLELVAIQDSFKLFLQQIY